jgi:hypothetical protein
MCNLGGRGGGVAAAPPHLSGGHRPLLAPHLQRLPPDTPRHLCKYLICCKYSLLLQVQYLQKCMYHYSKYPKQLQVHQKPSVMSTTLCSAPNFCKNYQSL